MLFVSFYDFGPIAWILSFLVTLCHPSLFSCLRVTPCPHTQLFTLCIPGWDKHMRECMGSLACWVCVTLFNVVLCRSPIFLQVSSFLYVWITFCVTHVPHFHYLFISWWTYRSGPFCCYCTRGSSRHECAGLCVMMLHSLIGLFVTF